jgi:hypothetical protein
VGFAVGRHDESHGMEKACLASNFSPVGIATHALNRLPAERSPGATHGIGQLSTPVASARIAPEQTST